MMIRSARQEPGQSASLSQRPPDGAEGSTAAARTGPATSAWPRGSLPVGRDREYDDATPGASGSKHNLRQDECVGTP